MWTKFRFLTLFAALSLALNLSATTFEYNADGTQNQTIDGITIKLEKGGNNNAPAYSPYNGMKLYANNTITIDASNNFKNVQLVFSKNDGKDYLTMTASVGELTSGGASTALDDKKIDVWNGDAGHLVFTMGTKGQRVLFQIVVDGDPIDLDPADYTDDTPLDPEYVYTEPTVVNSPDKNFYKKEYSFVDNNIRVYCTQGSILNNDTAHYFNCNATQTISFEATKPIKGVVINGAVRKLFKASSDQGSMAYLSPDEFYPYDYQECESAVIITFIDATKVTISCQKQLRCYSVSFYFDANPTQEIWDCDESLQGIETVPVLDSNAPMYNVLGHKVNDTYQGIVIQNGHKYVK